MKMLVKLKRRTAPWWPYIWILYGCYEFTVFMFQHKHSALFGAFFGFLNAWLDLYPANNPGTKLAKRIEQKRTQRHG